MDATFYNHCIHLSLSFQEQSDLSSKTSTSVFIAAGKDGVKFHNL